MLPSLARDMVDPKQFDTMINWAFVRFIHCMLSTNLNYLQVAATVIYGVIGASGYLMFGNSVSDEVSFSSISLEHIAEEYFIGQ